MITQFADDSIIYKADRAVGNAIQAVESDCRDVCEYMSASGLEVAPGKCQLVVFNRDRNIRNRDWTIEIQGMVITSTAGTKFLGIQFEDSLKWVKQINSIE